ncbi:MAG: spore maturation protein [Firmicutes bacterium]|nr:spore maturation protein [Bacillota bacterium]
MINKIWGLFIVLGVVFALATNNFDILNKEILTVPKQALDMTLQIFPVLALWLGIMNIAKKSGLLDKFSKLISPILKKIFPEVPNNHEALGFISSSIIANMFGLGNAATPFGLKAMKSLQELNNKKDTASRSMITFLVLNTSGMTIVPTTIISLRMLYKSASPTEIVFACILATICSTIAGLIIDRILAKRCLR